MKTCPADPIIRACHLAGATGLSPATLNTKLKAGQIPSPDGRGCGNAKLWRLSTIRSWNPAVADAIARLLTIPTVNAA